jgi:hypothetical protein
MRPKTEAHKTWAAAWWDTREGREQAPTWGPKGCEVPPATTITRSGKYPRSAVAGSRFKSGPPTILHERRMTMFNVRIKNSKLIYTVYAIDESDTGDIIFLVFDTVDQIWFWELANNCVPA